MNTNLSLNKSSCQMLVLLHRIWLFLCLKLFHFPFWGNGSGVASTFVAPLPSRNTCLAILATPICWPLGLWKMSYSPALFCAQVQEQCCPLSAGQAVLKPHCFKAGLLKLPAAPVSSSFWLTAWLAVPALNMAPALSILRSPSSSSWCVCLPHWSPSRGEHLPFTL